MKIFSFCLFCSLFAVAAAADDGTSGSGSNRYLSSFVSWSTDHRYDSWGSATTLSVGTGAGAGHLEVQPGARVEIANALFIGGKGYDSSWRVDEGHDGLVVVGQGAVLSAGGQSPHASGAHVYVGWGSGVKGTMRLNGGELVTHYMLHVGSHAESDGLLEVLDGGRVTLRLGERVEGTDVSFLSIATASGSTGLLRLDGSSTLAFEVAPGEQTVANIGEGGQGTLLVEGGSRASLGQDFAQVGVNAGSRGMVHVRGAATLELPQVTYAGLRSGTQGDFLVEGSGSHLQGQELWLGGDGSASLVLQDGAAAQLDGAMNVGMGSGEGLVSIARGAELVNSSDAAVGSRGMVQLEDGGLWQTRSAVAVDHGGEVMLRGRSRWVAQESVEMLPGSTLSFLLESVERLPMVVVSSGESLTMGEGSRMVVTLSADLLRGSLESVALPLIDGDVEGDSYTYLLRDETGFFDASGLEPLPGGEHGLSLSFNRNTLRRTLANDAVRLANGLWSSTSVMNDFTSALLDRQGYARCRRLWGMGIGSFSRRDVRGGVPGFDYNGGGYAFGADVYLRERSSLGVSFGQVYGTNRSTDGIARIRQNSLMASLYGHYDSHPGEPGRHMVLDAYAACGRVHNRARSAMYNSLAVGSSGRWRDDVFALGVRAAWEMPLTLRSSLMSFMGLRYIYGSHGGFTMASVDDARAYGSSSLYSLSVPLGVTFRSRYTLKGERELLPELTFAYMRDVCRRNPRASTGMLGEFTRSYGANPGRHAFLLRAGASLELNEHWSAGIYYHLEYRRADVEQAVNASVSYGF